MEFGSEGHGLGGPFINFLIYLSDNNIPKLFREGLESKRNP